MSDLYKTLVRPLFFKMDAETAHEIVCEFLAYVENFPLFKKVLEAGANVLVSGTTIFKENEGDIKKNIDFLKSV